MKKEGNKAYLWTKISAFYYREKQKKNLHLRIYTHVENHKSGEHEPKKCD